MDMDGPVFRRMQKAMLESECVVTVTLKCNEEGCTTVKEGSGELNNFAAAAFQEGWRSDTARSEGRNILCPAHVPAHMKR